MKQQQKLIDNLFILSRNPDVLSNYFDIQSFPFNIIYVPQNICDPISISESVDYIIHAATETKTSLSELDPILLHEVIVTGTKQVLDFAIQNHVKRVLYISSGAVYGKLNQTLDKVSETNLCSANPSLVHNVWDIKDTSREFMCIIFS